MTSRPSYELASPTGRLARWLAGWRVALRIARRDVRRHPWRSALIVVMVGLPVLLLTGGITLIATKEVSAAESVPREMGSAEARINYDSDRQIAQSPEGRTADAAGRAVPALAVPGFPPDASWTTDKVQKLTGGHVIEVSYSQLRVTQGDRRRSVPVLGIDAGDPLARGMTDLVSGRWASTRTEIVVTEAGIDNGMPRRGTLTITGPDGMPQLMTVVGVATGHSEEGMPFLVAPPEVASGGSDASGPAGTFLVGGPDQVSWSDVRRLNGYGLVVRSRHALLNPPTVAELGPAIAAMVVPQQGRYDLILLLAAVGLFIETTLLAGPAFAVSAARQRRSVALAASNGAQVRQLRRYVLGQAVVLGVLSAAVAVVAGVVLTWVALTWWKSGHGDFNSGPFEVPWPRVLGVFTCSVIASLVAALLPAAGVGRLEVVSVLSGRSGDTKVRPGLPVAGVVVMVGSGFATIWSVASGGEEGIGLREYLIVAGALGLVIGCLMVIPALLALVGRLGTHLALPLRLAARDTARQRGRSTPAVAAIMAAVAAVTALSIGALSYTGKNEALYRPTMAMGTGALYLPSLPVQMTGTEAPGSARPVTAIRDDTRQGSARAVTARFAPRLKLDQVGSVPDLFATTGSGRGLSWVALVPNDCSEARWVAVRTSGRPMDDSSCGLVGTTLSVGSMASLLARFPLSAAQRGALEGGGVLINVPGFVSDGQVRLIGGSVTGDQAGGASKGTVTQRTRAHAVVVVAPRGNGVGAWILSGTAKRLGWPVQVDSFDVTSPTGTISPQEESAVADRLDDGYLLQVERGYQNQSWLILLILISVTGLLVLVASLISTALSLAESQNDMATFAAVGATRGTRRGVAAAQAFVVATCGCLLGVGVGLIPGIASTWPLTVRMVSATQRSSPLVAIPWLPLLGLVLLVPLFAGALAWLAVRRSPQMTRRLS